MSDRLTLVSASIGRDMHARALATRHHGEGRPKAPSVHEMAINALAALDGAPPPPSATLAPDVGRVAQAAAEAHLDACWEAHEEGTDSPACDLFCGCQTCCVRETLHAAWDVLVKHGEV
jgi:hypothetical protein